MTIGGRVPMLLRCPKTHLMSNALAKPFLLFSLDQLGFIEGYMVGGFRAKEM